MKETPQWLIIDLSMRSIMKVISVLLGLWFLYSVREIVLLFFLVIIIVMSLAPIVDRWQRYMSRVFAVSLLFAILLAIITTVVSILIPPLVNQVSELAANLPQYAHHLQLMLAHVNGGNLDPNTTQQTIQTISQELSRLSTGLFSATLGVLGGLISFLTMIVLAFYLLLEEQGIRNFFYSLLPVDHKSDIVNAVDKVGDKLGAWLRGQLLLMLIIGVATGIWTAVLGLPFALTLALWAGLTEIIPFIGPIIGGIPILIIAFLDSPLKALIALVLLVVVQQLESNFIVPKIMQRSVGLSPVIVILALLIGDKLFGIPGTILSVPVAATVSVVIQEWPKISKAFYKN